MPLPYGLLSNHTKIRSWTLISIIRMDYFCLESDENGSRDTDKLLPFKTQRNNNAALVKWLKHQKDIEDKLRKETEGMLTGKRAKKTHQIEKDLNAIRPVGYIHSFVWLSIVGTVMFLPIGIIALKYSVYSLELSSKKNPLYWPEKAYVLSRGAFRIAVSAITIGVMVIVIVYSILLLIQIKYGLFYFQFISNHFA